MDATQILNKLVDREDLTSQQIQEFIAQVMRGEVPPTQTAAILTALRMKGESIEEILGCIQAMRAQMVKVNLKDAIDVCGTGGDGKGIFNVSTAVTFVIAGAGINVAKHGNRAASSKCGAADVLEELCVNINLTPQQTEEVFKKVGAVFLFAPLYHPATKQVVLVRKELKIRTVFNFLGPFLNPASTKQQLIGVPNQEVAAKLAEVAKILGYQHLLLVTSEDGLDEVSISANTVALEVKGKSVKKFIINPEEYGIKKTALDTVAGGDAQQNAKIIRSIFDREKGPLRDIVVLNSGCALYIAGKAKNIKEGISLAEESIDSGNAKEKLLALVRETQSYA